MPRPTSRTPARMSPRSTSPAHSSSRFRAVQPAGAAHRPHRPEGLPQRLRRAVVGVDPEHEDAGDGRLCQRAAAEAVRRSAAELDHRAGTESKFDWGWKKAKSTEADYMKTFADRKPPTHTCCRHWSISSRRPGRRGRRSEVGGRRSESEVALPRRRAMTCSSDTPNQRGARSSWRAMNPASSDPCRSSRSTCSSACFATAPSRRPC